MYMKKIINTKNYILGNKLIFCECGILRTYGGINFKFLCEYTLSTYVVFGMFWHVCSVNYHASIGQN
jgi:hypothetical protein